MSLVFWVTSFMLMTNQSGSSNNVFDLVSESQGGPHCSKLSEFEIQSLLSNLSPIERPSPAPSSQHSSEEGEGLSSCRHHESQTSQIQSEANIKVRCDTLSLRRLI